MHESVQNEMISTVPEKAPLGLVMANLVHHSDARLSVNINSVIFTLWCNVSGL